MTFEFKLYAQDFLDFQLFTASKSVRINKKKRNGRLLLTIGAVVVGLYFYFSDNFFMTLYCGLIAILTALFYSKYFKWRHKQHYKAFIKENYSKQFDQITQLEFREDVLLTKDKTGESKINLSEIVSVDETKKHFFLKISTGLTLIIPKNQIELPSAFSNHLQSLGMKINNEKNWTW